jgi:hypothetical protein
MNVEQSPLLKQLESDPQALKEFLARLMRPAPENADATVTLDNIEYKIERSPAITRQTAD